MADLQKVNAGDSFEIGAGDYNAMVDAAIAHRDGPPTPPTTDGPSGANNTLLVRNDTEEERDRFEILGIGEPLIKPDDNLTSFLNRQVMAGETPTKADHWGRFVILVHPLAEEKLGTGYISGITAVRLKIEKEFHIFADVADGESRWLESSDGGAAQILWKEEGLGVKLAIVRLGVPFRPTLRVWIIIREVEFDDVPWVWVERAKLSDEYATNGGLFVGVGPLDPVPEREYVLDEEGEPVEPLTPIVSDEDWGKILDGWEKMTVDAHRISQDYVPAVWPGPILTREPDIFPAERTGKNWHIGANWRFDVRVLSQDVPMGSCRVVQ